VLATVGFLASCSRTETRRIERVAVVPFENLSGDASLDWIGPALARSLTDHLTASVQIRPVYTEDSRAARSSNIVRVLQGYYTSSGDRIHTRAVLRDLGSQKNVQWMEASNPPRETGLTAESFAKALDSRTRPFGTQNPDALKAWGESMRSTEVTRRSELLETAIVADPNFGMAYADLIQVFLTSGNRERATEVTQRAMNRAGNFTDLDRARIELLDAGLRGDQEQRRKALVAFSRLVSTDLDALRSLAELELNARRFDTAVEAYRNAAALAPDNASILNQLGYAEAYHGNISTAREALERYRALDPEGLNPVDSLGEVHFITGRFAEAEKYFLEGARMQEGAQSALELIKAAQARYMTGNVNGADELYTAYEQAMKRVQGPLVELRRAQWLFITGRQPQAIELARTAIGASNPEAASYARIQVALWMFDAGERSRAAELAGAAVAATRNPSLQRVALLVKSASDGSAAPGEIASLAQAYAAISAKDFARAAGLLKEVYERTPPPIDGPVRTMYAWALAESGKTNEARALLTRYFIPLGASDEALLTTHAFAHFVRLRSALNVR
jgi:tetratricopeptide (TPR) repeat protein